MGRRKVPCVVQLQSAGTYEGQTPENVCSLELLQQKYDQAVAEPDPTRLYEDTTIYHVERIKRLFTKLVLSSLLAVERRSPIQVIDS